MQTNQSQGERNTTILPITQPEKPLPPISPLYFHCLAAMWPKRQITARWLFWLYNYIWGAEVKYSTASPHPCNSFLNKLCFPIKSMFYEDFPNAVLSYPFICFTKWLRNEGPLTAVFFKDAPVILTPVTNATHLLVESFIFLSLLWTLSAL